MAFSPRPNSDLIPRAIQAALRSCHQPSRALSTLNGGTLSGTLGAAGLYRIRLEFDPSRVFMGITAGPTDTVSATLAPKRYIVVGDSFTEPTIEDSGSFVYGDGWPVQLSYLTGLDIWCAGSGGTGYLNPNSGGDRLIPEQHQMLLVIRR